MFFNIGGAEILVIAMVALIAVGPEQLPSVLRKIGRVVAQARSMTAGLRDEFMSGLDEVKDLTGLDEIKEIADPDKWLGSGTDDDPVVPRGYAAKQQAGIDGNGATPESSDGDGDRADATASDASDVAETAPDETTPDETTPDETAPDEVASAVESDEVPSAGESGEATGDPV